MKTQIKHEYLSILKYYATCAHRGIFLIFFKKI